jgi:hypothetical protein
MKNLELVSILIVAAVCDRRGPNKKQSARAERRYNAKAGF